MLNQIEIGQMIEGNRAQTRYERTELINICVGLCGKAKRTDSKIVYRRVGVQIMREKQQAGGID